MAKELRQAVATASAQAQACAAVEQLYGQVQQAIDQRRPVCVVSGRCCRFEEFGHRLYVTTLELAVFYRSVQNAHFTPLESALKAWDGTGCPYQVNKLCTVHAIRPFGCRMFFCDATSTDWQNQQYEQFHHQLKMLHEQHGVPYFYVEWRAALRAMGEELKD